MPNQHSKTKRKLTVWTEEELKEKAKAILKEKGLSLTDEIEKLLIKIINSYTDEKYPKTKK